MTGQVFVDMTKDLDDIFNDLESTIEKQIQSLEDLADQVTTKLKSNTDKDCKKLKAIHSLVQSCCNKAAIAVEASKPGYDFLKLSCNSDIEGTYYQPNPELLNFFIGFLEDLIDELEMDKAILQELVEDDKTPDFYENY